MSRWLGVWVGVMAQAACGAQGVDARIQQALSAAPAAIAAHARVAVRGKDGRWTELRRGDNGWTCEPPDKGDPEPKPACFDANGLAFIEAMIAGKAPDPARPGYSYMLQGGSAWSNLDPAASGLSPGQRDYVHIPPHFMILNAKMANESGLPLHEANPDTHRPFVMFGGTKYAMLMIPVR